MQVVYVARNPKDMCVSYYHHCRHVYNMKGTFEEFAELFLQDKGKKSHLCVHFPRGCWRPV